MRSLAFGLMLLATLGLLTVYLTSNHTDNVGGPIMGTLGVLAVLLSVGWSNPTLPDRSDT